MTTCDMLNQMADLALQARLSGVPIPRDKVREPRWILTNVTEEPRSRAVRALAKRVVDEITTQQRPAEKVRAEEFVRGCATLLGLGFHPDTRFESYVDGKGHKVFSRAAAADLQARLDAAFALCDPFEIGQDQWRRLGLV